MTKTNLLKLKLFLLFIVVFSMILTYNLHTLNKNIEHELKLNIEKVKLNVDSSLYYFKKTTTNINHFISNNKKILQLIKQANNSDNSEKNILRKELTKRLTNPYERIKNMGVVQFHFVLADNESFLRMHSPHKFGDNLSQVRESYNYVQKHKKPIFAFENGRYLQAYRYVYPIFDLNNTYIGAFEMSYSTYQLQKDLNKISKIHNHFILKKELMNIRFKENKLNNQYIKSIENDSYIFLPNKDINNHQELMKYETKIIKKHKRTIALKMLQEKEFALYTKLENKVNTITFLPVRNLQNKLNAYIVIYDESNYIKNLIVKSYIINTLIFLLLAGLFVFIYFLNQQKFILNKLISKKTKELDESLNIINEFVLYSKTDKNGKILDVSDAFCSLTEYEKNELIGKNHRVLRPKELKHNKIFHQMWETLLEGNSWQGEISDISKTGKKFWLDTKIVPVKNSSGEITEFNAYRVNISDRKSLEELNNNLEEIVLKEISKNLKQKDIIVKQERIVALGNMMDAIAHQWKQPLSIISLCINNFLMDYILKGSVTQKNIDYLEHETSSQIDHLVTTIDEFRSFFRPDQELVTINLYELTEETIKLMQGTIIHDNIEIKLSVDKNLMIQCIPNEFKHIIINLVNNSKDAFNENNTKARKINFTTTIDDGFVILNITDNAGGIHEDILKNIFTPNFTTKSETQGTGIGLYMVQQIIEKLNGTIEAYNVDNGVCFRIKLKLFEKITDKEK